jgi:hypothetical protein
VVSVAALAQPSLAADGSGTLTGWVEDTRGAPIAGALISIFGRGVRGAGLVTFSDSSGKFSLGDLPAGSYTLRALAGSDLAAPPRQVSVLPNHNSVFTLSLAPSLEAAEDEAAASREAGPRNRELRWLLRHKRRSVLESQTQEAAAREADGAPTLQTASLEPSLPSFLAGRLELLASPELGDDGGGAGAGRSPSLGAMHLRGRFAGHGRWSLGGLLAESETSSWRMAAEFVVEPADGHQVQAGMGYGKRYQPPLLPTKSDGQRDDYQVGAIFLQDRIRLGDALSATVGGRYSRIAFLEKDNHFDPIMSLELRPDGDHTFVASYTSQTLTPGGDLLSLSTLALSTAQYAEMRPDIRAEKVQHAEVSFERTLGSTRLGTFAFYEHASDRLINVFTGRGGRRSLHVLNSPGLAANGLGVSLGHSFGHALRGSLTYCYGQSRDEMPTDSVIVSLPAGDYHDIVARLEAAIRRSDTTFTVYYRLNSLSPEVDTEGAVATPIVNRRFDFQLIQGVPFLDQLTRAEWDLLLALRNVFYEPDYGGAMDEMAVLNPPTRVTGGFSVQF